MRASSILFVCVLFSFAMGLTSAEPSSDLGFFTEFKLTPTDIAAGQSALREAVVAFVNGLDIGNHEPYTVSNVTLLVVDTLE